MIDFLTAPVTIPMWFFLTTFGAGIVAIITIRALTDAVKQGTAEILRLKARPERDPADWWKNGEGERDE